MTTPISIAQQIHKNNNPTVVTLEELLLLLNTQNGNLVDVIQQLISGMPNTEVHFGISPPDNPSEGDLWYQPDENRLYSYTE